MPSTSHKPAASVTINETEQLIDIDDMNYDPFQGLDDSQLLDFEGPHFPPDEILDEDDLQQYPIRNPKSRHAAWLRGAYDMISILSAS